MKATTLRIGNLVYLELGLSSLDIHKIQPVDIAYIKDNDNRIKPIPLTNEWLYKLRFGLTINNRDSGYKQFGTRFGKFDVMICIECNEEPECFLEKIGINIKYVHQLQNLYFVLTGEELKIL